MTRPTGEARARLKRAPIAKAMRAIAKLQEQERRLSKKDWARVFAARCQTKQGRPISDEDRALVEAAYRSDPKRYAALDREVFNATVPFGSATRWKR